MRRILNLVLAAALVSCMVSCHKFNTYGKLSPLQNPAYIRVFNDISTVPTIVNNGNLNDFLTFVLDPVWDSAHAPINGSVIGDYLATRLVYNISYPSEAANSIAGAGFVNYEYPGRTHVLTAPPMNGFDLSSWAQIPAGSHRLLFVSRPVTSTPFDSLSAVQRSRILVDTTLDFQAGEVYTIEAMLKNVDQNAYAAYVRQETFVHQNFSTDSIYLDFFDLSATIDTTDITPYSTYSYWFKQNLQIIGTYYRFNYTFQEFDTVPGYLALTDSLQQGNIQGSGYMVFPMLDNSAFFTPAGLLGAYGQNRDFFDAASNPAAYGGTLPFVHLQISGTYTNTYNNGIYEALFWASPVNYENLYPDATTSQQLGYLYTILPNLNLILNTSQGTRIYPSLNFLELINGNIYMTQIQNGFTKTGSH